MKPVEPVSFCGLFQDSANDKNTESVPSSQEQTLLEHASLDSNRTVLLISFSLSALPPQPPTPSEYRAMDYQVLMWC